MNATARVQPDLSDEERELLWRGLLEWGGPAECTEVMAIAIGFRGVTELLEVGHRIAEDLRTGRNLTRADGRCALLATEVVFASELIHLMRYAEYRLT